MTTTTMIHPFLQRADTNLLTEYETGADSSIPAKGRLITRLSALAPSRFIPSYEGQSNRSESASLRLAIHPFLRRADLGGYAFELGKRDSSLPAKGRLANIICEKTGLRFIPSCEGQAYSRYKASKQRPIHPFLRRAGCFMCIFYFYALDSSLPAKGRHSVFMRLSAALNTSLCNLHKCHSWLIHIFNMPKNPPHFHFFSNYFFCFSTPITRDIPAPYDLDRPTPFLIKFRNAFASLTRSRNSYPNTLTG